MTESGALAVFFADETAQVIREDIRFNMRRGLDAQACVGQLRQEYAELLGCARIRAQFVLAAAFSVLEQGALYPMLRDEARSVLDRLACEAGSGADGSLIDAACLRKMQDLLAGQAHVSKASEQTWSYGAFAARDAGPA